MNDTIRMMFELGYALTFGIFGLITLFLAIPKEKGIEYYIKARRSLGMGLCSIAIYCVIIIALDKTITPYLEFWLLVTFTLIHSWATYASLLFLLETPRYLTRHFFIDGVIPAAVMIAAGFVGIIYPHLQTPMEIVFGVIFGIKCVRMFYTCIVEYKKCKSELDDFYDESPDINWIRNLIYTSLFMSIITILSLYIKNPIFSLVYYLAIPAIYAVIVFRILNFMPKKIEDIRSQNIYLEKKEEKAQASSKAKELDEKIGPRVEKWVSEKNFCQSELTIKDVAMQMGTNHNYLSAYLNNHLNITFQVWLNTLRIEESKLLLISGEKLSIEEVGARVGIPQSYNFSRWFRIITDTTPYQYRKRNS